MVNPPVGGKREIQKLAPRHDASLKVYGVPQIAELHQIGAKPLIGFDIIDWPIGIVSQ